MIDFAEFQYLYENQNRPKMRDYIPYERDDDRKSQILPSVVCQSLLKSDLACTAACFFFHKPSPCFWFFLGFLAPQSPTTIRSMKKSLAFISADRPVRMFNSRAKDNKVVFAVYLC